MITPPSGAASGGVIEGGDDLATALENTGGASIFDPAQMLLELNLQNDMYKEKNGTKNASWRKTFGIEQCLETLN